MPQAQFDFASDLPGQAQAQSTIMDNWMKLGANARAQRARKLFADNLDEKGRLNETGFYQGLAESGLGAEDAGTAMDWYAKGKGSDVNTAIANEQLRAAGVDPNAQGRNSAQIGAPAAVEVPNPAAAGTGYDLTKDPDIPADTAEKPSILSAWWDKLRGKTEAPAAQPEAPAAAPQPGSATDMGDLGSSVVTARSPWVEASAPSPTVLQPGVDNRSARQMVEDSYNPDQTAVARMQAAPGAAPDDDDLTTWEPTNDGTNQYTQFRTALDAKLKSNGFTDASSYLKAVRTNTFNANLPTPPNPGLILMGKEGQAKYQGEVAAYQAGIAKAKGLASQAVMKARDDLSEYAKQFGVNTVEQAKSEVPGALLRDPAKRNEYSSLNVNAKMIPHIKDQLQSAQSYAEIVMAAPQVFRAASTAMNPGQQLSEGNLAEQAARAFPEFGKAQLPQVAAALLMGFKGDMKPLEQIMAGVSTLTPDALRGRLNLMLDEAAAANKVAIGNYVRPAQGAPEVQAPVAQAPAAAPDKNAELAKKLGMQNYDPNKPAKPKVNKPKAPKPAGRTSKRGPI